MNMRDSNWVRFGGDTGGCRPGDAKEEVNDGQSTNGAFCGGSEC